MDEVIGLEDAKKAIVDAVKTPMEHPELIQKYGVKAIKGILMFGPPGNGKTMLMRAVSNELKDVTMLTLSGARCRAGGSGQGDKHDKGDVQQGAGECHRQYSS